MARKTRQDAPDGWHHIMNRGAKKEPIFLDDTDRLYFVELLSELDDMFDVEVHAYCLMGNHYHLLARSRSERLSEAMQWLGICYSKRFNWRHGFDGSPFRGRFHAKSVGTDEYLVAVARYIHRNPLDLGFDRLATYPWSSLAPYIALRAHRWVHTETVLELSGGVDRYEQFVQSDNERADRVVSTGGETDDESRRPEARSVTDLEQLTRTIVLLSASTQSAVQLTPSERERVVRRIAIVVAVDAVGMSMTEVAEARRLRTDASARSAVSRARRQLAAEPIASSVLEQVIHRLTEGKAAPGV